MPIAQLAGRYVSVEFVGKKTVIKRISTGLRSLLMRYFVKKQGGIPQ